MLTSLSFEQMIGIGICFIVIVVLVIYLISRKQDPYEGPRSFGDKKGDKK